MGIKKRIRSSLIACVMTISLVACSTSVEEVEISEFNIDEIFVELGSGFDESILGIIDLDHAVVDVSAVDFDAIGVYEGKVITETATTVFTINVQDTTAPEMELLVNKVLVLEPGDEVVMDELVEADDISGVTLSFEDTTYESESGALLFEEAGTYKNNIVAEDGAGNIATKSITFLVGISPEIEGVADIFVEIGEEIDYLSGIAAVDGDGNDLTEDIMVDSEEVDIETEGTYEVTYSVIDVNGFSTVVTCAVNVGIEEEIEEEEVEEEEEEESEAEADSSSSGSSSSGSSSSSSGSSSSSSGSSSSSSGSSSSSSGSSSSGSSSSSSGSSSSGSSSSSSGSSSSGSSSSEATSTPEPEPEPEPETTTPSITGAASVISSEALSHVNEARVAAGLSPLTYNASLGEAAKLRAAEQSLLFSHTRPDGSSATTAYGSGGAFGECLAKGQTSAYSVVASWKTSSAHWETLMGSQYTQAAIAYYVDSSGTMYWCALVTNY